MGNTHSAPATSYVDRNVNKLSKPRLGSHRREGSNKSPVHMSRDLSNRSHPESRGAESNRGREKSRAATWQNTQENDGSRMAATPSQDGRARRASSVAAAYTEKASPISRYASRRNSMATPAIRTSRGEIENDTVPDVIQHPWDREQLNTESSIIRRRSQLFAAPPATASRRQELSLANLPVPETRFSGLLALDLADIDNVKTPSGYSVLGGFKRGSLRIMNQTSPSPMTPDVRPRRRNTSPGCRTRNPNASSTSIPAIPQTPHAEFPTPGAVGYFDFNKQDTISCTDIPKLLSSEKRPDSVIDVVSAIEPTFESPPTSDDDASDTFKSVLHISNSEPNPHNVGFNVIHRNAERVRIVGNEAPLLRITNAGQLQEFRRQHLIVDNPATNNPVNMSANPSVHRSLSNGSSIYSSVPSVAPQTTNSQQKIDTEDHEGAPSRRPSVRAGIDSAYGSMKSWRSTSWRAWSKGSSSPTRSRSQGRAKAKGTLLPEAEVVTMTQSKPVVEQPLRSTDKYRLSATIEGPVVEITSIGGRKSSLTKTGEHQLGRKKSIGEKLRAAVSITDLRNAANSRQTKDTDISVEIWQEEIRQVQRQLRHSQSFDAGPPERYKSAASLHPTQRKSQQPYTVWSERSHSAPSLQSTPQLRQSRSFSQLPRADSTSRNGEAVSNVNKGPAEYYNRFSKQRDSIQVSRAVAV
ncbi:hypothetical protein DFH27DRAFT_605613 [Peziza echinospora]|nr:hypothetical protein DFH27DRAFT_605613 [Peziza echinospora]